MTTDSAAHVAEILSFWIGDAGESPERAEARLPRWYGGGPALDEEIRTRFGTLADEAARGGHRDWQTAAHGSLALVILLDQFPRNLHRGRAEAFACDAAALETTEAALARGQERALDVVERGFLLTPFMHSEDAAAQTRGLAHFERLVETSPAAWRAYAETQRSYAIEHHAVIERFGRFPHRNAALGRESTEEERRHLEDGGARWGQ
jgi:uncharacterized protein (DUF924 family)